MEEDEVALQLAQVLLLDAHLGQGTEALLCGTGGRIGAKRWWNLKPRRSRAQDSYTLKLWDAEERAVTLGKVTFPKD